MKLIRLGAMALAFSTSSLAQDASLVSPGTTKVLFENDEIRVVRATFAPGAQEPPHTHPAGYYVVTKGGELAVTGADGKTTVWTPATGETEWSDGEGVHTARNTGDQPFEYILVEAKKARTKFPNKGATHDTP